MLAVRPGLLNWEESDLSLIVDTESLERIERMETESEAKGKVETMLESLTPRQRELIRMAKLEELPLAEVALRLGMSLSAVKVGVHRAMTKLSDSALESEQK